MIHGVSAEPLLGPIDDLHKYLTDRTWPDYSGAELEFLMRPGLDWVIVSGESGPGARPMHPDWAQDIRDQCQAAGVAYFHKQNGEYVPADGFNQWGTSLDDKFVDPKLVRTVRVVPGDIHSTRHMVRVGKKRAGRRLNGRTWDQMPNMQKE